MNPVYGVALGWGPVACNPTTNVQTSSPPQMSR